jgi:WD40 repeat protein
LVQLAAPLVMIALVASGTAMLASSGRMNLSGERAPIAMIAPVRPPASTDLAGDLLPDGALARLGSTRFLHAASPTQIAYAPDGATLASFDGALYLWDPSTGRERHRIETGAGHGIGHVQFAFAPDGQSLAVIAQEVGNRIAPGEGHNVFPWTDLYDPRTGRKIRRFAGGGMDDGLAFSPDGRVLAGAGFLDGKPVITLLEVASGRVIRRIGSLPNAPPRPLAFLPDGRVLFCCVSWRESESKYDDMTGRPMESAIYLREVATGKEIRHIRMGKTIINDAVLASDGKTVATATTDQTIRLWDLATGREIRRFGRANADSDHLVFSPDGTKLASAEKRMSSSPISTGPPMTPIHIWDAGTGRELRHWETDNASQIGFSPDGTTLASVGGGSQVIRLWDVATGREIRPETRLGHHSAIEDAAFAPDGRSIVTVGRDRTIRFWDPATGKEVRQLGDDDLDLRFTALSADGRTLATGGGFQPTRLWDVASGRELRRFQMTDESSLERADLSPDGNTPATSADDTIREPFVECADLSPNGLTLATSWNDRLILWDTATGRGKAGVDKSPLVPRFVTKLVKALRFAPDGQSVATLGGHWIRIWDVAAARETRRIVMPNAPPWRPGAPARPPLDEMNGAYLAFSPDGKILAASSQQDGQVCLIDMASGKEIARLDGPGGLKALAFSPDGKVLATGMETGEKRGRACSIRLWDVTARRELCRVEAHRSGISALAFSPDGRRLLSASWDATALVWDAAALIGRGTPPADDHRGEGDRRE